MNQSSSSPENLASQAVSLLASGPALPRRFWLAASAGVAIHNGLFRHGEWHLQASTVLLAHVALALLALGLEVSLSDHHVPLQQSLWTASATCATYVAALMTSMAAYRVFFHRLRGFDGPVGARISKFWHTFHCLDSRNYLLLERLRKQYGPFVRTGPNELTVFHPDAHRVINGVSSKCTKAPWYDLLQPIRSIFTERRREVHKERRRIWNEAFGPTALPKYEAQILTYVDKLNKLATESNQNPVNVTSLCYWFGFDIMGEFALGRSFHMLESETFHEAVMQQRSAITLLGPFSSVPWLVRIAFDLLKGLKPVAQWNQMLAFDWQLMKERLETDATATDVASYLIADARDKGMDAEQQNWLHGDSVIVILAGSETTATTLLLLLYNMARYPSYAEKLYNAVRDIDVRNYNELQEVSLLTSIIHETMRLFPAIPSGIMRQTPEEGVSIGGRYIPGGTTIVAPRYSIGRLESCFERPDEFIPERWDSKPEMVKDKAAFSPFSQGRNGCVGKQLALMELRFALATLVKNHHVQFAPGETGDRITKDMTDTFTMAPGKLELVFRPRDGLVR